MTYAKSIAEWGHYPPVNNNILINPAFTVKQRGDVIQHEGLDSTFGPDRWWVIGKDAVGSSKVESSTKVDTVTGVNKLVVETPNATDSAYTFQNIEAVNILGMYGKEMTFSFSYSDTGGSGVPKVLIRSWDSSNPETVKTLFDAIPTSLGNNRWTCTFTLSTADGTIPPRNKRGMQVSVYANEDNIAPNEWSVWETKLEVGSVATPFIARSYGEELALCQRYFQKSQTGSGVVFGVNTSTIRAEYNFRNVVTMRASPTVSVKAVGNFEVYSWNGNARKVATSITSNVTDPISYIVIVNWSSAIGSIGDGVSLDAKNGDVISVDAEL